MIREESCKMFDKWRENRQNKRVEKTNPHTRRRNMKTKVDPDLCISCAVCTNMAPDLYVMNDDGVAEAIVDTVPADMEDLARESAEECPADAIINE